MHLLGIDIGSSSVKAALLDAGSGRTAASASSPETEMEILSPRPGWAEQDPKEWWKHAVAACRKLFEAAPGAMEDVAAVGLSYQMHGLVLVDDEGAPLRPAIIWCDSRAVEIGERAFRALGPGFCLSRLLNSPGNFTASRLAWVREKEPEIFRRARFALLPGDFIAMRMTGRAATTLPGLSEGIFWDFEEGGVSGALLDHFGIPGDLLPETVGTFSVQGEVAKEAASALGIRPGIPLSYRAGDQPNNAFSLGAVEPGTAAATAGTSGVIYAVTDERIADPRSRVNTFAHVNHRPEAARLGILLCINGTGSLYRWLRSGLLGAAGSPSYEDLNRLASSAPAGAEGLLVLPFGNGAERLLENRDPGASLHGLRFNTHGAAHVARASLEGIAFAFRYGLDALAEIGRKPEEVRAGRANLFLSPLFTGIFGAVTGLPVTPVDTDGAAGAARGAGVGAGVFPDIPGAFAGLEELGRVEPDSALSRTYGPIYGEWKATLLDSLETSP